MNAVALLILLGVGVVFCWVLVWALCRMAAIGDENDRERFQGRHRIGL